MLTCVNIAAGGIWDIARRENNMKTLLGMPVIFDPHLTPDIIIFRHLHPIVGGHIWVDDKIEDYPVYLVNMSQIQKISISLGLPPQYILTHASNYATLFQRFPVRSNL